MEYYENFPYVVYFDFRYEDQFHKNWNDHKDKIDWCRKNIGTEGIDWLYDDVAFYFSLEEYKAWFLLRWA
jgi:hypothetical protein